MTEPNVADLLDAWLARWGDLWAPSTVATHTSIARTITAHLGPIRLHTLTIHTVEDFYADLAAGRRHAAEGVAALPMAHSTIHRVHSVLLSALSQAMRWGWLERNPARRAARPRPKDHRAQNLDVDGLVRVVRTVPATSPFGVLVRLAAVTGARRGELCAIRLQDFDESKATLRISRAISVGPRQAKVERGTKTGRARTVGLDRTTVTYLRKLTAHREAQAVRNRYDRVHNPFVFSAKLTGAVPRSPNSVTAQWIYWRQAAAPTVGSHDHVKFGDLRHLAVTQLLNAGVPVPVVAQRVGHTTPATTLRNYAHALPVDDHDAADLLALMIADAN